MTKRLFSSCMCLIGLVVVGCAQAPKSASHSLENPVHRVSTATASCPVCAMYSVHRANVVRLIAGENQGAGVIVGEDGRILTSAHVIADAEKIIAETYDGKLFEARVLANDADADLALIQMDATGENFSPVDYETDKPIPVGSKVFVIGHPAGLGWTVSQGIVSGLRRAGEVGGGGGEELIQTDAAISPGNSGGPLLDEHGHLLGIVRSKRVGPGIENLSFAVPMSVVSRFLEGVKSRGSVSEARTPNAGEGDSASKRRRPGP